MGSDLGGKKFDQGKAPLGMLPRVALEQEAQVMEFGAKKYGKFNYRKGMKWSRLIDAALRHIYAFADGQDKDEETGLSHLAHARCCLGFLLDYEANSLGEDDRKPNEKAIPAVDTKHVPPAGGYYKFSNSYNSIGDFLSNPNDPKWANQSKLPAAEPSDEYGSFPCPCPGCQDIGDASGYCGDTGAIQRIKLSDPASGEHPAQSKASGSPIETTSRLGDVTVTRGSGTGYDPYTERTKGSGYFRIRLD